ncbi:hypothetical protein P22_3086 [Propionispora sp. 2/2-37]|uniref:dihydroorotate dehydrogenase electron transfer subunit n=1 Tax=Propionispora sp. 2/2-37 TaxID=1677858 RepID=UPI0006BB69EC|nr:dihydroorotate dehydrogenase electron transfer subunit [Propionispora sp. 2/2-37]CUH96968.1 hypothetical protein P22_3086 [Propionispora sp. 2/2-37]
MPKLVEKTVIIEQRVLAAEVRELVLDAPVIAAQVRPGQFVHVRVANGVEPLLRRPFSIAKADAGRGVLHIIYRIVGKGTAGLSLLESGDHLDCMGPLGNGFIFQGEHPLLVGGGMGLAPLAYLAQQLCPKPVEILMGGRSREEMFWISVFEKLCRNIHITTDDGSLGTQGVTLDQLPKLLDSQSFDMVYTCGPKVMMAGVVRLAGIHNIPSQISLEDFMACGVGACLSCTCAGSDGKRRKVCSEGPVFWGGEVSL